MLFVTNAVTIAAASIFIFFALGFSPPRKEGEGFLPRSLLVSFGLMTILLAPLGYQSYQFVREATENRMIEDVVSARVERIAGSDAELVKMLPDTESDSTLVLEITIRSISSLNYRDSVALRDAIASELQRTVQLQINMVFAARLDPAVPPTFTPTITPAPSSTPTTTVLPSTPTTTSTNTPTSTATSTPTSTPTFTPTPESVVLENTFGGGVYLREFPNGPALWLIAPDTQLTVLYGYEIVDGWVWIEVVDPQGRLGWIPQFYTVLITLTPTPTLENASN